MNSQEAKLITAQLLSSGGFRVKPARKSRWMEATFIAMGAALILQAFSLDSVYRYMKRPVNMMFDPYGNIVVVDPARTETPLLSPAGGYSFTGARRQESMFSEQKNDEPKPLLRLSGASDSGERVWPLLQMRF